MLRLDLHVHTSHSYDGHCGVGDIAKVAKKVRLDGIAITDHDSIDAHTEAEKFSTRDFVIIPGIEVSSADGHILGLGIRELVPRKLSATETVTRIKEQGGIAIAAHPFNPFGGGHKLGVVYKAKFDAIEAVNSRSLFLANPLAQRFARQNRLPITSGSDAHYCDEVGMASTTLNCGVSVDSILEEIKRGGTSISGRTLPISRYMWRALQKILQHAL